MLDSGLLTGCCHSLMFGWPTGLTMHSDWHRYFLIHVRECLCEENVKTHHPDTLL